VVSSMPRWGRLSAGVTVTLLITAGVAAALTNFVSWWVAVGLGVVSATAGLIGTVRWDRHTTRTAWVEAWNKVADPGPAIDPVSAGNSLLAALNPDQQIVAFSPLREHDLRPLLHWCTEPGPPRIWLVGGDAGCGKTRFLIEAGGRLDQDWTIGWVRRGKGADAAKLAVAWGRPVLLIVDDADTHPDLTAILTAVHDSDAVRVLAAGRDVAQWWPRLRTNLTRMSTPRFRPGRRPSWARSPRTRSPSSNALLRP
jgi:hypothetical protein